MAGVDPARLERINRLASNVIAAGFAIVGTASIGFAVWWLLDVHRLETRGTHAEGVVTRVESQMRHPSGGRAYERHTPVVRFRDGDQEPEVAVRNRWAD